MNVCIIPARGGSKRINKKNIKNFAGKPIIKYSIDIALNSKLFDQVIVSTDNNEIAQLAKKFGAKIPFKRPDSISDDFSGIQAVITHGINFLRRENTEPKLICCLLATAPFVKIGDLIKGKNSLKKIKEDRFTFSATKYNFPIQRALSIDNQNLSHCLNEDKVKQRSQDLEEFFMMLDNFIGEQLRLGLAKNIFEESMPILLPSWQVQDLDTLEDWKRAELMYMVNKKRKTNARICTRNCSPSR